jgi:molybdopterin-guanine dinucleotide biosynthesis protein A
MQDADDAPQRAPERVVAAALTGLEQRELDAVAAALQRIERGAYGQCADCGADIPFDRLLVEHLLRRIYDIDMHTCPNCDQGRLEPIATILDPDAIARILAAMALQPRAPPG